MPGLYLSYFTYNIEGLALLSAWVSPAAEPLLDQPGRHLPCIPSDREEGDVTSDLTG